jgi:hypothetical protein
VRRSRRRRPAFRRGPPARGRGRPAEDRRTPADGVARWATMSARVQGASPGAGRHRSRWRSLGVVRGARGGLVTERPLSVSRAGRRGMTLYAPGDQRLSGLLARYFNPCGKRWLGSYLRTWSGVRRVRSRVLRVPSGAPSVHRCPLRLTESRACRGAIKGPSSGIRCQ